MVINDIPSVDRRLATDLLETGRSTLGAGLSGDVSAIYREAERFFDLPERQRRAASLPFGCGYLPFGQEHSGDPSRPDQVDIFVASPRMTTAAQRIPSEPARALHEAMMAVFDVLEARAEAVTAAIASTTAERPVRDLSGGFRSWSLLQLHRARPLVAGRLINEPHEDGHALTFAHATSPGLEIEVAGAFVAPAARTGHEMVVMPGHALSLLTGGAVHPLRHRVVARECDRPRMSLMFFADLDPMLCTPWRSTAFNRGVDVGAFVRGNSRRFGVEGFASA